MNDILQGINVYLVGMMGSGKTTVGQELARHLGYRFFDTDTLIERVAEKTVSEIFATEGEVNFRQLEHQVLCELAAYQHSVIATGGGIVIRTENWSYLRCGLVVWLDAPVETLFDRLRGDSTRPLLDDRDPLAKLEAILAARRSKYEQADLHVLFQDGESPAQIAQRIFNDIPTVLKSRV